jgi:hypothetical protein
MPGSAHLGERQIHGADEILYFVAPTPPAMLPKRK